MSPVRPIPMPMYQLQGISRRQIEEHYKLYVTDVDKERQVRSLLLSVDRSDANPEYSPFRELKVEESYICDSVRLHEWYFANLGGPGGRPTGALLAQIVRDFGAYENWEYDFISVGKAARGWAVLFWDNDLGRLFNGLSDAHNLGPVWQAVPLLVLDVYEHAYFLDYGADRDGYIRAFMNNVNWAEASRRFAMVPPQPLPQPIPAPVPGPLPVPPNCPPGAMPIPPVQPAPIPPAPPAGPGLGSAPQGRSNVKSLPYPYNLRPRWPV